jgi:outer membrane lipoprotein-sorting protein
MSENANNIDVRLRRLGERLAEQPSVAEGVMGQVDRAGPVRVPRFNQGRILTMLFKPRNLVAAAAVLALVVFGLRPWTVIHDGGGSAWWLAPPSAWAGELQAAIEQASRQAFSCREQFVNVTAGGAEATSSSTSTLFVTAGRYRRDNYEQGRLRESQWYVQAADGLTMTSVRYDEKTYTLTHDPKARQNEAHPVQRIEALARLLDESGRRVGAARIEGRDAVEFEIGAKTLNAQADDATTHVWLEQSTKMPLKMTHQFAAGGGLGNVVATILVQDHFDWNPTLPADTFEPEVPAGFSKVETE